MCIERAPEVKLAFWKFLEPQQAERAGYFRDIKVST